MPYEYFFASRADASSACASRLQVSLQQTLAEQDSAALVVSGGSSPVAALHKLSSSKLPWQQVTVTLSDERWVDSAHEDSNERMIRQSLLVNEAASASFMPLFRPDCPIWQAPKKLRAALHELPLPFATVLLGMGEDGHFASLFPDFDGLSESLGAENDNDFVAVNTAASPHARISMTLAALLRSREIVLLLFGDAKKEVYEAAKLPGSTLPVASLLTRTRVPLRVIWAP